MTNYAKGPWTYRGTLGPRHAPHLLGPHVVENALGQLLATMNGWATEESKANARLMAAAPEMLDALHKISLASQNSMSSKEECGRIARAAIVKAIGDNDA